MELYKIRDYKEKLEKAIEETVAEFQLNTHVQVNEITLTHRTYCGSKLVTPGTSKGQPYIKVKLERI